MRGAVLVLSGVLAAGAGAQAPGAAPPSGEMVVIHSPGSGGHEPPGYLGIVFTAPLERSSGTGGVVIRHLAYPVVESVEPGSPAAHAGISAGDTIMAYDSADVLNRDISLTRLLRPGARVLVRIRRNGMTRDVPVRVARRPASFVENGTVYFSWHDRHGQAMPGAPAAPAVPAAPAWPATPASPMTPGASAMPAWPATPAAPGAAPMAPMAPMTPAMPTTPATPEALAAMPDIRLMLPLESSAIGVAGAEVVRANSDLCAALGASHGVLVLDVADGTPAQAAGLRAGDVIVEAGRTAVTAPLALMQAVEESSNRELALTVVRARKEKKLSLKW